MMTTNKIAGVLLAGVALGIYAGVSEAGTSRPLAALSSAAVCASSLRNNLGEVTADLFQEDAIMVDIKKIGLEEKSFMKTATFHCPVECNQCCAKERDDYKLFDFSRSVASGISSLFGGGSKNTSRYQVGDIASGFVGKETQDTGKFTCVLVNQYKKLEIKGRTCELQTHYTYALATAHCTFTTAEQEGKMFAGLQECYTGALLKTWPEFLGYDSEESLNLKQATPVQEYCSITKFGARYGLTLTGAAIDTMFFNVGAAQKLGQSLYKSKVIGGACGYAAGAFFDAGLTETDETASLCERMNADYDTGRLDKAAMALWTASAGPLRKRSEFDKPSGRNRVLRKFKIPGWSGRAVAYEHPEADEEMTDLSNGGFQCMMRKLYALPMTDNFKPGENSYLADGVPRNGPDVNQGYFGHFGIYQDPLHFMANDGSSDAFSDATVGKLVFEAIGAHRLEPIGGGGKTINLSPISVAGLATYPFESAQGPFESATKAGMVNARFIVRVEGLFETIKVRPGMGEWGGNAFFDAKGKLIALQYRGETLLADVPAEKEKWSKFKFIFRSSLVSLITAFDHLVSTHILASDSLAVAVLETLPADHKLRIFLKPHTWGAVRVNMGAAQNLFAPNMLVHRSSPFVEEAFGKDDKDGQLWQMIPALRYQKFEDSYNRYKSEIEDKNELKVPFFEDGKLLHDAIKEYVKTIVQHIYAKDTSQCNRKLREDVSLNNFIANFFEASAATPNFWPREFRLASNKNGKWQARAEVSCDSFANWLGEVIFLVTGWHRHVGTVQDFVRDTRFAALSWVEGDNFEVEQDARPKHSLLMSFLAATTNANLPKLNQNLNNIYRHETTDSSQIFENFFKAMTEVQQKVDTRNALRLIDGHLAFHQMEPKHVEWGVAV